MAVRQQQRLSQRREAVALTRKSLAQRHSDQAGLWLDRNAFEELIRPPLAGTVEASRSDLKTTATPAPTMVEALESAGSDVRPPAQTQIPRRLSLATMSPGSADIQGRQRAPRRFTRFAAAGVLALVGAAASVPLIRSHSGSIDTTAVGHPAPAGPVAAVPASDLASIPHGGDSSGTPVAAPNNPADGPATSSAAAERTPRTVRSASRFRPPAVRTTPPQPPAPAIPADAYAAWSRLAALSADHHDRHRHRPEAPRTPDDDD